MHLTVNFEPDKDYTKISVNDVITRLELGIIIIIIIIIINYIILLSSGQYGYDTSEWGAKALANISYSAMVRKNTALITNFLDIGACER